MTTKEAIEQLESLRQSSSSLIDDTDPEDIFAADVEALDMAIENMKKAVLLEQETAIIEKHIQDQYTKTEQEIQEKICSALRYCLVARKIGIDCFFYYSPHVDHISVDIYSNGWNRNLCRDMSLDICTDEISHKVMTKAELCNDSLRKIIYSKLHREVETDD